MHVPNPQHATQFARYPSLSGRAVLITGGASGIGASLVEHFARQGCRVAFLDIQEDAANALVERLSGDGAAEVHYLHCDITKVDELQKAVVAATQKFGGLDVLVNNAGNDQRHNLDALTVEDWDKSMAINLRPHFFTIQAALPALRDAAKAGHASIINMSSICWVIPSTGVPAYGTAKAGIVGLTRTLARELGAEGIRINAVLPGAIATERQKKLWYTPEYKAEILASQSLKCELIPDDVARMVLFLAADDSSAITSQSFIVDGGWV